jgi:hypothetical protein
MIFYWPLMSVMTIMWPLWWYIFIWYSVLMEGWYDSIILIFWMQCLCSILWCVIYFIEIWYWIILWWLILCFLLTILNPMMMTVFKCSIENILMLCVRYSIIHSTDMTCWPIFYDMSFEISILSWYIQYLIFSVDDWLNRPIEVMYLLLEWLCYSTIPVFSAGKCESTLLPSWAGWWYYIADSFDVQYYSSVQIYSAVFYWDCCSLEMTFCCSGVIFCSSVLDYWCLTVPVRWLCGINILFRWKWRWCAIDSDDCCSFMCSKYYY